MCIDGCEINISNGGNRNTVFGRINHFRAARDQKFEDGEKEEDWKCLISFVQYGGNWNLALPEVAGENVITTEVLR